MAWVEADRANIRHYMGFGALFLQADPRLEAAINNIQAISDGGTRPDNSTELQIRGWIGDLQLVENNLRKLWGRALALEVDEISIDPYRGMMHLRSEGRRLVGNIATALSTTPRTDVFSTPEYNPEGSPWPHLSASRVGGGAE